MVEFHVRRSRRGDLQSAHCRAYDRDGLQDGVDLGVPQQKGVRDFLRVRTSYDVLPLSFRLIILDNDLLIRKSLAILTQNGALL